MRKCPKCSLEVAGEAKICRVCGAILDEVPPREPVASAGGSAGFQDQAQPKREALAEDEPGSEVPEADDAERRDWKCVQCGEQIEANFDICWNCGTSREGTVDPEFQEEADIGPPEPDDEGRQPEAPSLGTCPRCQSNRIIPDVQLVNEFEHSHVLNNEVMLPRVNLRALVIGQPEAWIFQHRMHADIRADVCGRCGHMELRVVDPEALYEHYIASRSQ